MKRSSSTDSQQLCSVIKNINSIILTAIESDKDNKQTFFKLKRLLSQACQSINLQSSTISECMAVAYYNLAVYGSNESALTTAIRHLTMAKSHIKCTLKWKMQLAVIHSSSHSDHATAYDVISQVYSAIIHIFTDIANNPSKREQMPDTVTLIKAILWIVQQQESDDIIWVYNQRNMLKEYYEKNISQLKNMFKIKYPFYGKYDFHISDVMALQRCHGLVTPPQELIVREYIMMLSICSFTKATEKVYLKDYSQKDNHIKALKIALTGFGAESSYCQFLLDILVNHFGKKLTPIHEDIFQTEQYSDLIRRMPRQPKEVPLRNLLFANE